MASPTTSSTDALLDKCRLGDAIPEVTIVIPLYNYSHFILNALESVRAQTLANLDLIVIDDRSTDGGQNVALQWLETHATRFRRALLLRHRSNSGLAATRNAGFQAAVTPFVFPLDADNALYPTCLEKLLRSALHTPAAFCYCLVEIFGFGPDFQHVPFLHMHGWNPALFARDNYIDAMALVKKSAWELVGGYTTTMPHPGWEDYDFWLKIHRAGGHGVQVKQILARYRMHKTSMLRTVTNHKKHLQELRAYMRHTYPEIFMNEARSINVRS